MASPLETQNSLVSTGVEGLDEVLGGGLMPEGFYLVEGAPGTGKTTLGLHFALEGVRQGERALYVTLTESEADLHRTAASHGWSLDGVEVLDLTRSEENLRGEEPLSVFYSSEVELGETTKAILEAVERIQPKRVVVDSLSEVRLLAQQPLRHRRQLLALRNFLEEQGCTALLLDDGAGERASRYQASIADGVLLLEQLLPEYGGVRRRLWVAKIRGRKYMTGYHDFLIEDRGLRAFPRMVAAEHPVKALSTELSSGVMELDALLGGGIPRGSSVLVGGPAGSGKTSIPVQFAATAAGLGERSALFVFDETRDSLLRRMGGLGLDLQPHVEAGRIHLQQVDPAELSAGQFAHQVRQVVESGARLVVIDTLNGYLHAMRDGRALGAQLHELLTYLAQQGATTFLVLAHRGIVGGTVEAPVDVSYIADTILLLRYFEAGGEVRKALSVVKKRGGAHETTIRELRLTSDGLCIGEPLRGFEGVLTGVPRMVSPDREPA